jgi:hypothetical protein
MNTTWKFTSSRSKTRLTKRAKSNFQLGHNRDKASGDIFWLRDEAFEKSDKLLDPDVLAQEIVVPRLTSLGMTPSQGYD